MDLYNWRKIIYTGSRYHRWKDAKEIARCNIDFNDIETAQSNQIFVLNELVENGTQFEVNAPELFESDASSMGPQTRTVPSSDADASMLGNLGFQWTQLTVLLWPSSTAIGISRLECQMYTLWSAKKIC